MRARHGRQSPVAQSQDGNGRNRRSAVGGRRHGVWVKMPHTCRSRIRRDRLRRVVFCRSFVIIKYSVGGRTISGGGHAAASFRDIPADPPRVEPGPMVWRSIAIAAQKFADSEPGLQIEDAHRGRPLIGRGDVWDRTGFAVSVLGTHSGNPARRSASARVARRSLFEETASINRPILKLGSSSSRRRALAAASVNRPSDAKAAV